MSRSHGNCGEIECGEIEANSSELVEIVEIFKSTPGDFFEEKSKSLVKDNKPGYGHVSREEFGSVVKQLQTLTEEFQKFREEMQRKKIAGKNYSKRNK